jgi:hypothetical protein
MESRISLKIVLTSDLCVNRRWDDNFNCCTDQQKGTRQNKNTKFSLKTPSFVNTFRDKLTDTKL